MGTKLEFKNCFGLLNSFSMHIPSKERFVWGAKLFIECTLVVGVPNKPPSSVTSSIRLVGGLNDMRDGKMRSRTVGVDSKKC